MRPLYSTLAAEDIGRLVGQEYGLPEPLTCTLMRRSFNDHYLVTAGEQRYIFRLYHSLPLKYWMRGEGDFRFELDLLEHLHRDGVPVSRALPRLSGDRLGALEAPEGARHYALFTYAEGEPAREATEQQRFKLGETLARLHVSSDRFKTPHTRYSLDLGALIDRQLPRLKPWLTPEEFTFVDRVAAGARRELEALDQSPGVWGIIHGDPHSGNCHFTPDGNLTLFDFDIVGYGWRAYDLIIALPDEEEQRGAMLAGYESVRPLSEAERNAFPALLKARMIWDTGDILHMTPIWGEAFVPSRVRSFLSTLRELESK